MRQLHIEYIAQKKYGSKKISGNSDKTDMTGTHGQTGFTQLQAAETIDISEKLSTTIQKMSSGNRLNTYAILLTVLNIMIFRHENREDITIISPKYNVIEIDAENFILIRNKLHPYNNFKKSLIKIRKNLLAAYEMQSNFNGIIEDISFRSDQNIFSFSKIICALDEIHRQDYHMDTNDCLNFSFQMVEGLLKGKIIYNTNTYGNEAIAEMSKNYRDILDHIFNHLTQSIGEIPLISKKQKEQILWDFNDTHVPSLNGKTAINLFEEQVERFSDKIAVSTEHEKITYRELNKRANQLAKTLVNSGININDSIGILLEPSAEMIIGILGILKTGCSFLPIDPEFPEKRIAFMLKDSMTPVLLTSSIILNRLSPLKAKAVLSRNGKLEILTFERLNKSLKFDSSVNLNMAILPENIAYTIYTSGSTGKPKGVLVTNSNLNNYVNWFLEETGITENDKSLLMSSFAFDLGYTSIFSSLLSGGELHVVEKELYLNPFEFLTYIMDREITFIKLTPSLLSIILNSPFYSEDDFIKLRLIILGGEKINKDDILRLKKSNDTIKIMNHYGPTEATIGTIAQFLEFDHKNKRIKNGYIGRPVNNTKIYILDNYYNLLPIGMPGELYISGSSVTRGYTDHKLTCTKFVPNPYSEGERIYKTGDVACWQGNGQIEIFGRVDDQVKIKGNRIELGEIENELISHPGITKVIAALKTKKNNEKFLCAYYVSEDVLEPFELRSFLKLSLPEYMIPLSFTKIDHMPLLNNGKVNRNLLPEPYLAESNRYAEPPVSEEEKVLIKVWQEVLGIKEIGINDNFFEIGGESIKAIQVTSKLFMQGYKIQIKDLLNNPRVKDLSKFLKIVEFPRKNSVINGFVDLTPIQKWFFNRKFHKFGYYNYSLTLKSTKAFKEQIIAKVFTRIIEHHDGLRMNFKIEKNKINQYYRNTHDKLFEYKIVDLSKEEEIKWEIEKASFQIQSSLDIERGPLVNIGLFRTKKADILLIAVHHLVVDGFSWRIIMEDFIDLYQCEINHRKIVMPHKTNSYKEWSEALVQYAKSDIIRKEAAYWEAIENSKVDRLSVDYTISRKDDKYLNNRKISVSFNDQDSQNLLKNINGVFSTDINDILLTALVYGFNDWRTFRKLCINLQGHGRESINPGINIDRTIGWFTSQFPVVFDISKLKTLSNGIEYVKQTLRKIPNKGIGFGIIKYLNEKDNKIKHKLTVEPEVSFNYLGEFEQDVHCEGLNLTELKIDHTIHNEMQRKYPLEIDGICIGGKLKLVINYNKFEFKKESIRKLSHLIKSRIIQIIQHCLTITRSPN